MRLTLAELKALKPGDKVHVCYQEDGGEVSRLDHEFEVLENNADMLVVIDNYGPEEFPWKEWDSVCQEFANANGGHGVFTRPVART